MTGRKSIQLRSVKEIVSPDNATGVLEEFVMVDLVSVEDEKFVLIVEAKRSSLALAMKQCLLVMKDMRDNNGGGEVYGFVTTGESWRMISYDGALFQMTEKMDVMFDTMDENKERWMRVWSIPRWKPKEVVDQLPAYHTLLRRIFEIDRTPVLTIPPC